MPGRIETLSLGASSEVKHISKANPVWSRSAIMLALGGLCAGIGITIAIALLAVDLRARAIDDRLENLANATLMLSAHAESALQALDSVQSGVIDQMRGLGLTTEERYTALMTTTELHQILNDRISALPYVNAVTLFDRHGKLLNFSRAGPVPDLNVSDRDHFKALSIDAAPERFVSKPEPSRVTGAWTVYLGRRISSPNGAFLGIILGAIDLGYFERFFAEIAPQSDAVVSMFRNDGTMLVRQPPARSVIGQSPQTAVAQILSRGLDHGTIRTISPVDGQDRLVAVRSLVHYPIVVSLSRTVDATLKPWREQAWYLAAIAALLDAGLAGVVLIGVRHLRGHDLLVRVEASLAKAEMDRTTAEESERNERAIAAYYERFNIAVNAMSQGLCMFDAEDRLIVSNPRFGQIFALPAQALAVGVSLEATMYAAVRNRTITIADIRWLRKALILGPNTEACAAAIWDIANGSALSVSFERMAEEGWLMTFEDITDRRRTEAQIAHMAHHDALTGLPNRTLFHERLVTAAGLAARGSQQGVLCLDLDHFKDVNDTLGHPIGDALLQEVTVRLLRCVRETDTVARLGGDEFAIILSSLHQSRDADLLADRLIEELGLPFEIIGHQVVVGVSIGISIAPDDGIDPDTLLRNADLALYRAKADGRGCCRYFKSEMDVVLKARHQLELELRRAYALKEFELFYQPLVQTESRRICGFEALLRWHRSDRLLMGPAEFIPVAEEMGLIMPLGKWVLETACHEAMSWPDDMAVAVNLSPVQFKNRHLLDMVRGALDSSGLAPDRLELEITETVLLNDTTETLSTLHQLRKLGVRISMDDFGTGYSSLSYLLKFPFDKVKIDRSFMTGLGDGGDRDAIIRAVTSMCHDLGMQTIAEGVETQEQLTFLQQSRCTEVQGFLFSCAVPGSEVGALLATQEARIQAPGRGVSGMWWDQATGGDFVAVLGVGSNRFPKPGLNVPL